jgi:capsular exopolysaccharide synthesis family protein
LAHNAPRSLFSEFSPDAPYVTEARRLLQSLMRRHTDPACKVFMVTSAARGEGKSTICGLLGLVAARIFHKHTLIIDGDMRRPTMHQLLDISLKPGLYELLAGEATLDLASRPTAIPLLRVIPSGRPGLHVHDSYDDDAFARLLHEIRPSYDLIFVDAAPAVPVVEPVMMAEHVDALLLVAMAGRTPVSMVRRLRGILEPVADKVVGAILNNATEGLPYYYDYSYYGYKPLLRRQRKKAGGVAVPGGSPSGNGSSSVTAPEARYDGAGIAAETTVVSSNATTPQHKE